MIKELPHSLELEESLVGIFLLYPEYLDKFFSYGAIEWFYDSKINKVIETLFKFKVEDRNIDLITISEELKGKIELSDLVDYTSKDAHSINYEEYAIRLGDLYKQRELIKEARKLENLGFSGKGLEDGVMNSISSINSILSEGLSRATSSEENINKLKAHIELNKGKELLGYSWGLPWLDKYTRGIRKGKTYRIGAPSGVGKTNLVYQVIFNLLAQNAKVLFISLENSIETTYVKILSTVQQVNPNSLEGGFIEPDYSYLEKNKKNFILTDQLFDIFDIQREVLKHKPDVVILDYIGLTNIKGTDERTLYDKYADLIKQFVQKNQYLSWIDLSNLNKDDDEMKIRMHRGFNGSAKLRNNTDVAIHFFYHQPFYDMKKKLLSNSPSNETKDALLGKQVITFLLSKNRLGPDGVEQQFVIDFNKGIRYTEATDEQKALWF